MGYVMAEFQSIGIEGTLMKECPYMGKEKVRYNGIDYLILEDEFGSMRFIRKIGEKWVGALQIIKYYGYRRATNLYVDEEFRRQGIAYELFKYALNYIPTLQHSDNLNDLSRNLINKLKAEGFFKNQ